MIEKVLNLANLLNNIDNCCLFIYPSGLKIAFFQSDLFHIQMIHHLSAGQFLIEQYIQQQKSKLYFDFYIKKKVRDRARILAEITYYINIVRYQQKTPRNTRNLIYGRRLLEKLKSVNRMSFQHSIKDISDEPLPQPSCSILRLCCDGSDRKNEEFSFLDFADKEYKQPDYRYETQYPNEPIPLTSVLYRKPPQNQYPAPVAASNAYGSNASMEEYLSNQNTNQYAYNLNPPNPYTI